MSLEHCPQCGKLIARRFPVHECVTEPVKERPPNPLTQPQILWHMGINNKITSLLTYQVSLCYWTHEVEHPRKKPRESEERFELRKAHAFEQKAQQRKNTDVRCFELVEWVKAHPYPPDKETP